MECAELTFSWFVHCSFSTSNDFPEGKKYNEGEYLVLINEAGIALDLSAYTLLSEMTPSH